MFIKNFYAFIALLLMCMLTTSCSSMTKRPEVHANSTSLVLSSPLSTALPVADTCPVQVTGCFTPYNLRVAYGIEPLVQQGFTGKGQTIIDIVSFGSPTLQQDMQVFDQAFHLPPADLQVLAPLHIPEFNPNHDKNQWAQETEMDVQIMHAMAPEAKIVVLQSPVAETEGIVGLPQYRQLEQYVIDHQLGSIVSHSWGASELTLQDTQSQQETQKWNDLLKQGTIQRHITYFSASGDTGATDYVDTHDTVGSVRTTSFAADSPWVTAVGGTTLESSGSAFHEVAWSNSGGGFSRFAAQPAYQKLLPSDVQQQFDNHRGVPDVAADADPNSGLPIYVDSQWSSAGGTSASTPIWAAIAAIANQMAGHPLGFLNPGLYKLATSSTYQQDFHDITEGNNSYQPTDTQGYSAGPGWDPVTGLGTPNAAQLIPDLIAALK